MYYTVRMERAGQILKILKKTYPEADCALRHSNPLELLVATILSAQCTDKRVNIVAKTLFKKYKPARDFALAGRPALEKEIRSTGFFRQKARWIQETCEKILEKHGGRVPKRAESWVCRREERGVCQVTG